MQIAQLLSDFPKRSLALLILLAAVQSQALTLGRIQGAALIGRPLAVSIAVQADAGQSLAASCFEADVFHGDNKQDPAGVKVRLEPTASGQGSVLRISSDTPVNEPIVTVYLRAGCAQAISRRYVLLADIVSEQAAPAIPRVGAVPLVDPVTAPAGASPALRAAQATAPLAHSAPAPSAPDVAGAGQGVAAPRAPGAGQIPAAAAATRRAAKSATAKPAPTRPAAAKPAAAAVKPAPAKPVAAAATAQDDKARAGRTGGQSRLRLDPLELLSERVATLESVSVNAPTQAAAREARDAQRLDSLEASVKSLVALAAKNEVSLLELRARLEHAQAERYNNPVVYLLLALLLLSLFAIAYLLSRSSRRARQEPAEQWWDGSAERQASEARASAPVGLPPEDAVAFPEPGPESQAESGLSAISEPSPLSQPGCLAPWGAATPMC